MPTGRMGHSATHIRTPTSNAIYMFGGYTTVERGQRQHRVATNELWALDLRGGLDAQQRDSPSSEYLKWVRIDTIGKPPAARGHHTAAASPTGGNLFIAFGCDAPEQVCYDDIYMLDTTYPQGHLWHALPVGMQRPAARQMLTAWVHSASLFVSGGCTPARDERDDHCYSDTWELPLEGLMQGGKQLNATIHLVEENTRLNVHTIADRSVPVSASDPHQAGRGVAAAPASAPLAANGGNTAGAASGSAANLTTANREQGNGAGGALHNGTGASAAASAAGNDAMALAIDTSLNDGLDVVSAATLGSSDDEERWCQMSNITKCAWTLLSGIHGAKGTTLELEDTGALKLGRIIRINPGKSNEEDNQVMGFGERELTEAQQQQLALAAAKKAADSALELADADESADDDAKPAPPKRRRVTETSFLQLTSRSLLPTSLARRMSDRLGMGSAGGRAVPPTPKVTEGKQAAATAGTPEGAAEWSPLGGGSRSVPFEASRRVHGRALHRHVDLAHQLRFAHSDLEPIVQLPSSVTAMDAAPGMQHMAGERSVHRQYDDDGSTNPLWVLAQNRRPSPPPSPPQSPPSPPSPPRSPPPAHAVFVAEDLLYQYDEDAKGAKVTPALEGALRGEGVSTGYLSRLSGAVGAMRARTANVSAKDLLADVSSTASAMPVWAVVLAIVGGVLVLAGAVCCCMRRSRSRRKAQLEDINPVFQTETWRKLE